MMSSLTSIVSGVGPDPDMLAQASNLILMAVIVAIFLMAGAAIALLFFGYLAYLEDNADAMWGPIILRYTTRFDDDLGDENRTQPGDITSADDN